MPDGTIRLGEQDTHSDLSVELRAGFQPGPYMQLFAVFSLNSCMVLDIHG